VFRNIYVEDAPRVLFSLKITPPVTLNAQTVNLSLPSVLNLSIENVFTPASTLENSIGFQTVNGAPLTGAMNIALTNIVLTPPNGTATVLTSANALTLGNITTNGSDVNIIYDTTGTSMLLSAAPNPVTAGQAVTLTASMSPSSATGIVGFFDG
jgi:hypothetical protein